MSCVDAVPLQDPSRLDAREQAGLPAAVRRAGVPAGQQPARAERTGERPISRAHPPANSLVELRSALTAQRASHIPPRYGPARANAIWMPAIFRRSPPLSLPPLNKNGVLSLFKGRSVVLIG